MKFVMILVILMISCSHRDTRQWTETDREDLIEHLASSLDSVMILVSDMTNEQWDFQETPDRWSTRYVIEHLIIHEELYHRELRTATALPEPDISFDDMNDPDSVILSYQFITSANSGPSPWYLQPKGRWADKTAALDHYRRLRESMIEFIKTTDVNLRAYASSSGRGTKKFRDLHQLVLISIAHTKRHTQQIRKILNHPDYMK